MKKLITTLFVLAALSTAAIAETKLLSVNFAIPLDNITTKRVTNYTNSSTTSSYDTNFTSVGFGFTGLSMFNKIAGLYADVEFGFVQSEQFAGRQRTAGCKPECSACQQRGTHRCQGTRLIQSCAKTPYQSAHRYIWRKRCAHGDGSAFGNQKE